MNRTNIILILLINIFAFSCVLSSTCPESWFTDDLPLLTSNEGWNFVEVSQNISTYWRESKTNTHIARIHKAIVYNIPASVEEVFKSWHNDRFSRNNLNKWLPFIQHAEVLEKYDDGFSDLVYEQHETPSYLSMYYPIAHRDWLYSRCVKKIDDSYVVTYRSEFDERKENATNYMRGWLIDSAVMISPSPLGKLFTQLTFIRQRSMMCCIPQAAHDTQQSMAMVDELSGFRSTFGGQGPCIGDYTNWRDDLHAACHLFLTFQSSCDVVRSQIYANAASNSAYQSRSVWSDNYCFEFTHNSYFFIEDVHFEISESRDNFCSLRAGSRTRSISHYDLAQNYCNIYTLLDNTNFSLSVDSCLYRPHTSPKQFCSFKPSFSEYLCTFDFFDYFCANK